MKNPTISMKFSDMQALAKIAIRNHTEYAWIEAALQWMEKAEQIILELEKETMSEQ